jgi:hypothetical protein
MLAAAGIFCTMMVGVLAEVAREEAPGEIVVVAHGVPDDHANLLVAIEILCSLGVRAG